MEPSEALGIAAQIAVALAGFAGVVVVFRRESIHEWSPADRLRLRLLLANSILPLGLCMVGLLLLTIRPMPPGIWRWCSGLAFVVSLLLYITITKTFRRLDLRQIQREHATRFVFYLIGTFGIAANLLQLYNTVFLGVFWPFFTGIVFQLVTALFQFARMILLPPEQRESNPD
jgi:drug/metabolite transporter (DMT)-like permease